MVFDWFSRFFFLLHSNVSSIDQYHKIYQLSKICSPTELPIPVFLYYSDLVYLKFFFHSKILIFSLTISEMLQKIDYMTTVCSNMWQPNSILCSKFLNIKYLKFFKNIEFSCRYFFMSYVSTCIG